jgi:hypothetical protein
MRFGWSIAGLVLAMMVFVGCSNDKASDTVAGIEIGNPALALTADFSVDYSEVEQGSLKKSVEKDEPVLLDSFSMNLSEVRSFSSYYTAVSINPTEGLPIWPEEDSPEALLPISFTEGSSVEEPFKTIDLEDEGFLKEIGVSFKPEGPSSVIRGRVLIDDEYVPFEYNLNGFQKMGLRYHFSQIERVSDSVANLSVVFHVRYWTRGIDFTKAEVSEDGTIYLDNENNIALWQKLNSSFVPSFRSLRYDYVDEQGKIVEDYVKDIWDGVIGSMSDNTITNGDFSAGLSGWIFFTQMRGEATASVIEEAGGDHILKVAVTNGGTRSYSVQLIQEDIALVAGKKYKCVFTIWSNVEGQITARIGAYDDYDTIGFQEHVMVGTSGKSVEIEFMPQESTPFARFELNLGNMERTFYIKHVKIYRLEK